MKMKKITTCLIMGVCLISLIGTVSGNWKVEKWDFDIQNVNFPSEINKGSILPVSVSVYNSGEDVGTVCIMMGIKKPGDNKIYPSKAILADIPVNQVKTATLKWQVTEPPGEYIMDIDMYESRACTKWSDDLHMFDTTRFIYPFTIKDDYNIFEFTWQNIIIGLLIIIILVLIFKK